MTTRTLHPYREILGDETYHLRNPLLPEQPLRVHKEVQLTTVEKNAEAVVHQSQKENSAALFQDLEDLRIDTEDKIRNLSVKYSKKESFIRDHICSVSSFKPQRKINLFNAEVSMRAKELRDMGREAGLKQARADVLESRAQRNGASLPPDRTAEILEQAEQQRNLKNMGARTTNLSATKDNTFTLKKLNKRTGAAAMLIVTRGHLNDSILPTVFESSNTAGFCKKVLGHSLTDVAAKLESFIILAQRTQNSHGAKDLRRQCTSAVHEGLRNITGKDDIAMNYQNYDSAIVSRYKVRLVGWPSHIPFANPSSLKAEHLQRLADALESRECRWRVLSKEEIVECNTEIDVSAEKGKTVKKARKERSDKKNKRAGGGVVASPTKKRRVAQGKRPVSRQLPPQALSKEFISDSEDGYDE